MVQSLTPGSRTASFSLEPLGATASGSRVIRKSVPAGPASQVPPSPIACMAPAKTGHTGITTLTHPARGRRYSYPLNSLGNRRRGDPGRGGVGFRIQRRPGRRSLRPVTDLQSQRERASVLRAYIYRPWTMWSIRRRATDR